MTAKKPSTEPTPDPDYDSYETAAERVTRLQAEADAAVQAAAEATTLAEAAERAKTQPPPERHELLAICEQAFVPHVNWSDPERSASAVQQLGRVYALLRADCAFEVHLDEGGARWWVAFDVDVLPEAERFYLPTVERVTAAGGGDWY